MGRCLLLLQLDMPTFEDTQGKPAIYLTEMKEERMGVGTEAVGEGLGGEE